MRDSYLLLTPILVLGVLSIVRFVGCATVLGFERVPDPPLDFVTDEALGRIRNDYSGYVGMAVDVGAKSLKVQNVQRYCVAGSTGGHRVQIIDPTTGTPVPNADVVVSLMGRPEGFVAVDLGSVVTLTAGQRYYVVSEEVTGGDQFFDNDTVLTTRPDATVVSPVYYDSTGMQWVMLGNAGNSYGPVNFAYVAPK